MVLILIKIMIERLIRHYMFKRLLAKTIALKGSATAGVAGVIVLLGGWIIAHPDVIQSISPKWAGVIVAGAGFAVTIARMRSL